MKFRTQLYLFLCALTFGTVLFGLASNYWQAKKLLFEDLRNNVLTVAATAAQGVNGDLLAQVHNKPDIHSPKFNTLVHQLRSIFHTNLRKDLDIICIYTIRPDPTNHSKIVVVVDPSEQPSDFAHPGELYPGGVAIGLLKHLNKIWAPDHLMQERGGIFLPGYAPIYNKHGDYVGTVGVNLSADYIARRLGYLWFIDCVSLIMTLIIGIIAAAFLARIVSSSLEEVNEAVQRIGHGDLKTQVKIHGAEEFKQLAIAINNMTKGLEDRDKLKLNFPRYISKHIMDKILSTDITFSLKGERRKITVLFSDIRDFTHLAEKLSPEEVVSLLNEYLKEMLKVIFKNKGTLDKFLGDGLMVEFGAPLDDTKQELHAVRTALQMHQALKELNRKWKSEGRPCLKMGIGIHTGQAIVGNIGSEERMEYTAIGDTVNVASRLEYMSKQLKVDILISETTRKSLINSHSYNISSFGQVTIPGRESSINVFSVEWRPNK